MIWILKHPQATQEMLGYIPYFLNERDPRPAKEQFHTNYPGGWDPLPNFTIDDKGLKYPGDLPMPLLAETKLRDEVIRFYDCAWVAVIQPDGSFEVSRLD